MMNCYVVKDGGEALVIDPGESDAALLDSLKDSKVAMIFNTHCHIDHCGGNEALVKATGAPLVCHEEDLPLLRSLDEQAMMFGVAGATSPEPDKFIAEGDKVKVGNTEFEVFHTPGHSPGHVVLVGGGAAIVGDVLFAGSIGRSDLPGGDHAQLIRSIHEKLLTLPDATVVYSGHGPTTTIGAERNANPFLV